MDGNSESSRVGTTAAAAQLFRGFTITASWCCCCGAGSGSDCGRVERVKRKPLSVARSLARSRSSSVPSAPFNPITIALLLSRPAYTCRLSFFSFLLLLLLLLLLLFSFFLYLLNCNVHCITHTHTHTQTERHHISSSSSSAAQCRAAKLRQANDKG